MRPDLLPLKPRSSDRLTFCHLSDTSPYHLGDALQGINGRAFYALPETHAPFAEGLEARVEPGCDPGRAKVSVGRPCGGLTQGTERSYEQGTAEKVQFREAGSKPGEPRRS
jgi:hypothetical protein